MPRIQKLEELYMEGWMDRQQARLSGVGGAIKGLGNTIAGGVKGAVAGATGNVAGVQAAQQQRAQGGVKAGYNKGKIASITQTFQKDLASLFGPDWAKQFPNLQKELGAVQQAQPAAPAQPAQGQAQTQQPAQQTNPPAQSETPPPVPNQPAANAQAPAQPAQQAQPAAPAQPAQAPAQPAANAQPDKSKPLPPNSPVTGQGKYKGQKLQFVNDLGNGKIEVKMLKKDGKPYPQAIQVDRKTDIVEKKSNKFAETYQALQEVVKL